MYLSTSAAHPLTGYGWDDDWAADFSPYTDAGLLPGRVARVDRGLLCSVLVADGDGTRMLRAEIADVSSPDPMRFVCTGDWVAVDPAPGGRPAVRVLMPRRTALVRSTNSKRSEAQVLAVNMDQIAICVSLATEVDLGRIERFLALAASSGSGDALLGGTARPPAEPLVVLTKADLVTDADHIRADVEGIAPGVTVLVVSAETGEGMDVLRACTPGSTALIGQSGAGKSTLTNALAGADVMSVQQTRSGDEKGRHTTTARELIPISDGGGVLIDTPGLREVGLYGGEGLAQAFAEIEELAEGCRFHDCGHHTEPGCAVQAALADGTLSHRRWESYVKLQRENEWIASRTDARLAAERLKKWKSITKSVRAMGGPVKY
ncbi:ribosome small subunit-dependent GTPase A [Kitasatospora sp. NPDC057223]|uniref:ribosome small subunit-dependent GTPase A n=1 Tax=Kitasatospora sp. NPDC057223 TaxID=3346055 RepID=UPI00362D20E0